MTLLIGNKKRKFVRDVTLKDASGATVAPGINDVVRVKVGRTRQAPLLDLDTTAASSNGSTVAKNTPSAGVNRVSIVQADMDLLSPGIYSFEISLVDGSDGDSIKHVDNQILVVQATQLGDVGTA